MNIYEFSEIKKVFKLVKFVSIESKIFLKGFDNLNSFCVLYFFKE